MILFIFFFSWYKLFESFHIKPTFIKVGSEPDTNLITFFLRYAIADQNIEDEILINIQ